MYASSAAGRTPAASLPQRQGWEGGVGKEPRTVIEAAPAARPVLEPLRLQLQSSESVATTATSSSLGTPGGPLAAAKPQPDAQSPCATSAYWRSHLSRTFPPFKNLLSPGAAGAALDGRRRRGQEPAASTSYAAMLQQRLRDAVGVQKPAVREGTSDQSQNCCTPATITHHVESTDTLLAVAAKYGVKPAEIKRVNRLSGNDIWFRRTLIIPREGGVGGKEQEGRDAELEAAQAKARAAAQESLATAALTRLSLTGLPETFCRAVVRGSGNDFQSALRILKWAEAIILSSKRRVETGLGAPTNAAWRPNNAPPSAASRVVDYKEILAYLMINDFDLATTDKQWQSDRQWDGSITDDCCGVSRAQNDEGLPPAVQTHSRGHPNRIQIDRMEREMDKAAATTFSGRAGAEIFERADAEIEIVSSTSNHHDGPDRPQEEIAGPPGDERPATALAGRREKFADCHEQSQSEAHNRRLLLPDGLGLLLRRKRGGGAATRQQDD